MKPITTSLLALLVSIILGSCQRTADIKPMSVQPDLLSISHMAKVSESADTPTIVSRNDSDLTPEDEAFFQKNPTVISLHKYSFGSKIYFYESRQTPLPKDMSKLLKGGVICPKSTPTETETETELEIELPPITECISIKEYAHQIEVIFETAGYPDVIVNIAYSQDGSSLIIQVFEGQSTQHAGGLIATIITALLR